MKMSRKRKGRLPEEREASFSKGIDEIIDENGEIIMSRLEELIEDLCPNGVEYKKLGDVLRICNGGDYKKFGEGTIPVYGSGGIMTYIDTYVYDEPSVLIPRKGSLDKLYYVDVPFWTVDTIFYTKISKIVSPRFVFFYLQTQHLERLNKAGGVPSLTKSVLNKILIPVPPLAIQDEIVRILDSFTELMAELMAELTARKQQYEFYRDRMLSTEELSLNGVEYVPISDLSKVISPKIKIKTKDYLPKGIYPVIDQGQSFISGYTNNENVFPKNEYVVFGDHTCVVKFVDFPFAQGADGVKILQAIPHIILPKYLFYCMDNIKMESSYARHWSKMKCIKIPVPSLEVQQKIVAILDRFDALCNDISNGLPAEIAARKKQYEFYRDKLLTFNAK